MHGNSQEWWWALQDHQPYTQAPNFRLAPQACSVAEEQGAHAFLLKEVLSRKERQAVRPAILKEDTVLAHPG